MSQKKLKSSYFFPKEASLEKDEKGLAVFLNSFVWFCCGRLLRQLAELQAYLRATDRLQEAHFLESSSSVQEGRREGNLDWGS